MCDRHHGYSDRATSTPAAARSAASVEMVSGNYFAVLGVAPLLGRTLEPEDDSATAAKAPRY